MHLVLRCFSNAHVVELRNQWYQLVPCGVEETLNSNLAFVGVGKNLTETRTLSSFYPYFIFRRNEEKPSDAWNCRHYWSYRRFLQGYHRWNVTCSNRPVSTSSQVCFTLLGREGCTSPANIWTVSADVQVSFCKTTVSLRWNYAGRGRLYTRWSPPPPPIMLSQLLPPSIASKSFLLCGFRNLACTAYFLAFCHFAC